MAKWVTIRRFENRGLARLAGRVPLAAIPSLEGEFMSKGRVAFAAAAVILVAFAVVLGFSSTSASAKTLVRTKTVIVGTSPSQPVAGEPFTMRFQLWRGRVPIHIARAGCQAQIGTGRILPVANRGNDGTEAFCTWNVPANASGKTFDGVVAADGDNGVRYFHGFDLPIS